MDNIATMMNGEAGSDEIGEDLMPSSSALLPMITTNDEELCSSDTSTKAGLIHISSPAATMVNAEQQTDSEINGSGACKRCQTLEAESENALTKLTSKYETEIARLRKEYQAANKAKETTVMRYAKSENEVIKLKRDMETSSKQITGLMKEVESLNKKQKMLSTERERLGNIVDGKCCEIQSLQKEMEKLKEELSAKDFKIKWTQNKLSAEMETHKETQSRVESLESELEKVKQSNETHASWSTSAPDQVSIAVENESESERAVSPETNLNVSENGSEGRNEEEPTVQSDKANSVSSASIALKELEAVKIRNHQLIDENNLLSCKVQNLEQQRLDLEQKQARLQESNSELHQIATLHSELAATESLKSELAREQEAVLALQNECQRIGLSHTEALGDMVVCRSKEAELLEYTQQVTEKNVTLQSEFSSVQAKSFAMEEENERLQRQIDQLQVDIRNLEKMMSQECKNYIEERQTVESDAEKQKEEIMDLQRQLDEARGEIVLLHKSLNAKIRELTRELLAARRNLKDGASGSDGMSQSSRASSSSSLNNIDITPPKSKPDDLPEKHAEPDMPVIPDQQILIERIVKLQRTLARKQEKIEFLQEHVKQLTETLQKKSKIITAYAINQDVEALSTELSEKNKLALEKLYSVELVKYGGIMASVYASKPADDGLTLDLSLEINRKLQIVLEDTLLKNITLKDSLNTLGKEISKLTELNNELLEKLSRNANPG